MPALRLPPPPQNPKDSYAALCRYNKNSLFIEKKAFEIQALEKRLQELEQNSSGHAPTAIVPTTDEPERGDVKPSELSKKQRRARLQRLRASATVAETKSLVQEILNDWTGVGLHVFEAIGILSALPDQTQEAIDLLFETLEKMFAIWGRDSKPRKIWHEIKGSHGRAARYLKIADRTLTKILMRYWSTILK